MVNAEKQLTPHWPDALDRVDLVKVRFALDFVSPCDLHPADILGLGRTLRVTGRQLVDVNDAVAVQKWEVLFQPRLSDDPVARRRFQKPSPAFVIAMPIQQPIHLDAGDRLELEVLFMGTGIPSIHMFLRCLVHLGHLGLVTGEGQYEVTEVSALLPDKFWARAWRQGEPMDALNWPVLALTWLVKLEQIPGRVSLHFTLPTRLIVDNHPLRKPRFSQVFPFLLRRVTSMLHAHCGLEIIDDPAMFIELARGINMVDTDLTWRDWRALSGVSGLSIGGFGGSMKLEGENLEELYWVMAVASLLGIGKGATYGAGSFVVDFE